MKAKQRLKIAGNSVPRVDAVEKVNGVARFTGDMGLPGMAYGKILRSPVPHAKLVRIDTREAESLPGVITVLTRDDLANLNYHYGATYKDQSVVAVDKVRFVGDPIAAVLAVDEAVAEQALAQIDVEYEDRPNVPSIEEAMAPGAPLRRRVQKFRLCLRGHLPLC
jgi:putative selenate reductase molybdopterin-binding subunit